MKIFQLTTLALTASLLAGCASNPGHRIDPYEGYNRKVFAFNQGVYKVITPVVNTYDFIVPHPVRTGIENVYNNLNMLPIIANDMLQGNFHWALQDMGRFGLNSTLGFFGVFDLASTVGLYQRQQGFGLTLAKWGATQSPYIELPFMGPSTGRDMLGLVGDYIMSPINYVSTSSDVTYAMWGLNFIRIANKALPQQKQIMDMAIDPYVALRNAYLQNRKMLIWRVKHPDAKPGEGPNPHEVSLEHPPKSTPGNPDVSPAMQAMMQSQKP